MAFEWLYLELVNGRLLDQGGDEINPNWPSFADEAEAEEWLIANDVRATVYSDREWQAWADHCDRLACA